MPVELPRKLGLDAAEQRRIYRAGLLHDIGKLGVSSRTLDKEGALTPAERHEIEQHPAYTWEILSRVRAFAGFRTSRSAAPRETGWERLSLGRQQGRTWTLPARILAVADMYEAMTADRPYRAGMTNEKALSILRREAGIRVLRGRPFRSGSAARFRSVRYHHRSVF